MRMVGPVRVLHEHAAAHERARRPRGRSPIAGSMSMPAQSPATRTLDDAVADERLEPLVQVLAERRAPAPAARRSRASRPPRGRPPRRAGCRRTSSRARPARITPSTSRSPTTADTGRMPPPSALPSRYRSGTTPTRSHANVAPTRPRPDWISSAMNSTLCSRVSSRTRGQVLRGRDDDAGLALDRLDEHGGGVRRRSRPRSPRHRRRAPSGTPGVNGPKSSCASGSSLKPDDRRGAAVEVAVIDDDVRGIRRHALHPVAPRARDLDAGLDGLGAGVHRQHHVLAAERGELGDERAEPVVVERAARERDALELLAARRRRARGCRARSSGPSRRRGSRGSACPRHPSPRRPRPTRRRPGSGW